MVETPIAPTTKGSGIKPPSAGCYNGAQLRESWYSAGVNGDRD
jgi:hypothetical protein